MYYSYPCRARLRLHAQTVPQAGSLLPETPATPSAPQLNRSPLATLNQRFLKSKPFRQQTRSSERKMPNETYRAFHQRSIQYPDEFWAEQAKLIDWQKPFTEVLDYSHPPFAKW